MTRAFDFERGEILLVDKPKGWTSFDVVKRLRSLFRIEKIGHAGTLDPMATGLLVICTGKKTRAVENLKGLDKEYEGVMELGATTRSFDTETEILQRRPIAGMSEAKVKSLFKEFVGEILQVPPIFSAVKVHGRRLYKYARKGEEVAPPSKLVRISRFEPTEIKLPDVSFRLVSSKGTYVRSLVNDFGNRLGCGAYLKSLIRIKVGEFDLRDALSIDEYERLAGERST